MNQGRSIIQSHSSIPVIICLALFTCVGGGCSTADLQTTDRMSKGLVIILPGIEGRSAWNYELARGLDEGGVKCGIEIYDWGTPVPGGMILNLMDIERNRRVAGDLKQHILSYRHNHPRRPVHLVGHSGGGGVAILTAEMMPREEPVSSIILLAAAISPKHDLSEALTHSQYGIFNYFSELDVFFLRAGTSVAGTIDREQQQSAGAVGFSRPASLSEEGRALYDHKLHEIKWDPEMSWVSNYGGHMDWTHRPFVRKYLGPLVSSLSSWRYEEPEAVEMTRHAAAENRDLSEPKARLSR